MSECKLVFINAHKSVLIFDLIRMFLVQKNVLLTLPNQEVVRYGDPKIQPFFAKMAGLAKVKPKMTGYQNFE